MKRFLSSSWALRFAVLLVLPSLQVALPSAQAVNFSHSVVKKAPTPSIYSKTGLVELQMPKPAKGAIYYVNIYDKSGKLLVKNFKISSTQITAITLPKG